MKLKCLDIELILSEEERIPCQVLTGGLDMGILDPTLNVKDLPANSNVNLPLWLATSLNSRGAIIIDLPKHYGQRMREEIRAGPQSINLRDFSFYFFEVGLLLAKAKGDRILMDSLKMAMSGERFETLTVNTLFSGKEERVEYCQELTSWELHLHKEGHKAIQDIVNWKNRKTSKLAAASVYSNANTK